MSLTTKIETEDEATPWLKDLQGRVSPHRVAVEIGPRVTRLVQRNLRRKGTNAKGWPSTHFYGRAAQATNWQEEQGGFVIVSVNQIGIRQRLMGGDILPVNVKNLALPAAPEAYGKTPREFDLKWAMVMDEELGVMRPALVRKDAEGSNAKARRGKGAEAPGGAATAKPIEALFWLAKKAHQDPDPSVMPSDEEFEKAFDESVQALLERWSAGASERGSVSE